jgi:hypothetical protein
MESKNTKLKSLETILVLVAALIIFFWVFNKKIFLLVALLLILIATSSDSLNNKVTWAWLKFSELLGKVMSKVILSVVYFVVLLPIAFLYKLTGKDPLLLKKRTGSYYFERNHQYSKKDIENIW